MLKRSRRSSVSSLGSVPKIRLWLRSNKAMLLPNLTLERSNSNKFLDRSNCTVLLFPPKNIEPSPVKPFPFKTIAWKSIFDNDSGIFPARAMLLDIRLEIYQTDTFWETKGVWFTKLSIIIIITMVLKIINNIMVRLC